MCGLTEIERQSFHENVFKIGDKIVIKPLSGYRKIRKGTVVNNKMRSIDKHDCVMVIFEGNSYPVTINKRLLKLAAEISE